MLKKFFLFSSFLFIIIFLFDIIFGSKNYGFESFISQNFHDYCADFFNHARLASDDFVYQSNKWQMAERGLSPIEYLLHSIISQIADFNVIPTIFLNSSSFPNEISKCIYLANYILCAISVFFFVYLYEKIKENNKYIKMLIIAILILSLPFMYEFERGNTVLLSVFCVSYFLFNYDQENKYKKELSLILLGFACALKFVPFLFLFLLLEKKELKNMLKVLIYSLIFFFTAMLFLNGGLSNIPLFIQNAFANYNQYKYISGTNIAPYFVAYLLTFMFNEKWEKTFIIISLILSMNHFTGYRLLYLYPCIILFFNKNNFSKIDYIYTLIFICLISPLHLFNNQLLLSIIILLIFSNKLYVYISKKSKYKSIFK